MSPERQRNDAESEEVRRVLKRQKELQDTIKAAAQELEEITVYLRVRARITSLIPIADQSAYEPPRPSPALALHQSTPSKKLGYGSTQPAFERLAREAMLAEGQPLETFEVVEVLRERGFPLGGSNEWKTASNRLWRGKQNSVFEHKVGVGYWPSGVPWPEPDPNRPKRPRPKGTAHRATGRPHGRQKALSDAEVKCAEQWLLEGKTVKEVAALLGVSPGTIYNYVPGGKGAVRERAFS
jgi:DNA-binding CsgD family transcriptional regulator